MPAQFDLTTIFDYLRDAAASFDCRSKGLGFF